MAVMKIAALISGGGTNLQAIIDACQKQNFPAELKLVISNNPSAYGLKRAKKAGIETKVINHKDYETRDDFEKAMNKELINAGVGLICLAGFMRLLNSNFVNLWRDRMINIHPSLLPSLKGLNTHERAIDLGVRVHGCTVHFVRAEMDEGPVILQAVVPISDEDTPQTLAKKVLKKEHIIYPQAIRLIASGKVKVAGKKVHIDNKSLLQTYKINPTPK
ncbi:MAG: phosphoribosylglycinamide formyltransferase [Sphingomonadales bacterium]